MMVIKHPILELPFKKNEEGKMQYKYFLCFHYWNRVSQHNMARNLMGGKR